MPPPVTHLAFLRAVNVGGSGKISMTELRAALEQLGFAAVQTLLQSGNLVLRGGRRRGAELELFLEAAVKKRFGLETRFFVRTPAEWSDAVAHNPFPREAKSDPSRLVVVVLKSTPVTAQVKALQAAIKGRETVRAFGRELYAYYPDGQGRSKLTLPLIEKHLGTSGTARNWNTATKMAALAAS